MSSTAFGKITAVYGHIDENGHAVRKWSSRKMEITDKCSKKTALSVNSHHNGQKFTDKSPENDGLSVKCVLITDKSAKNGALSVNSSEILACRPEQEKIRAIPGTDFKSLFSCGVRLHTFIIRLRPATRLMISSCRVVTALALITRAPPYLPPC